MTTLARQTYFNDAPSITAVSLNTEFNNIVNQWNGHDMGALAWQKLNVAGTTTFNTAVYTWPSSLPSANSLLQSTSGGTLSWVSPKVVQTATGTSTTNFNTTSSSYQSTNLTGSITPSSASNKIQIIVSGNCAINNGLLTGVSVSIFRGTTDLSDGHGFIYFDANVTGTSSANGSCSYLDSPATTSATTYTVKIKNDDNTTTVSFGTSTRTQSIILQEVV